MRSDRRLVGLRLAATIASLAGLALLKGPGLLVLTAALIVLNLLLNPEGLALFGKLRLWPFLLAPPLIGAAVLGPRDLALGALRLSREGLALGLVMSGRALCLLLTFQVALGGLSVTRLIGVFHSRGLKGLGFALGVAYNMLATLGEISLTTLYTLRLRGAFRRHPVRAFRLFAVTVVSAALRHAEDIVHAATVRGFDAR